MAYNDFEEPFVKDYKVASGILKQTADLYKNHTLLQGPQKDMLRLNLMASLSDPNTIKSLVSDFESEGLNFSDVPLDDMEVAKNMIVDRIMNSYTEVAAQGKAEYDARNPDKAVATQEFDTLTSDFNNHYSIKGLGGYSFVWNEKEGGYIYQNDEGIPHSSVMADGKVVPLTDVNQLAALKGIKRN